MSAARFVAVTSLRADLGVMGDQDGLSVVDIRHPDAVESALALAQAQADHVIVTCLRDDAQRVRRQLTRAKVRIRGLRAALEVVDGSPLTLGVISNLAEHAGRLASDPAGQLASLEVLRASAWTAVWSPTVSSWRHPAPSTGQHLMSLLRLGPFIAQWGPPATVARVRRGALPALAAPHEGLFFHTANTPAQVRSSVGAVTSARSTVGTESLRDPIDAFGSADAAELLILADDPAATSELVDRATACPGCDVVQARTTCPWCGMTRAADATAELEEIA